MMEQLPHDAAVIKMMMDQLVRKAIPRALRIRDRLDAGERLNDFDLVFLADVYTDLRYIQSIADRKPEYRPVVLRMVQLYKEISDRALENEQ